jgi:hypothetical protein
VNATDAILTAAFLSRLGRPIEKWPAYRAKVIDIDGKILVKKRDRTREQSDAFGTFDAIVLKIKKFIQGGNVLGELTAAGSAYNVFETLREDSGAVDRLIGEMLEEDAPTNSAGSGQAAGMGVPEDSIPGKRGRTRRRVPTKMFTRRPPVA